MELKDRARSFCENPSAFFDYSNDRLQTLPKSELETLQLAALQLRFEQLRPRIPALAKLADKQKITEVHAFDDVVTLLFDHAMYKSYPPSLLHQGRFDQMTRWLDKLTVHDLSGVDARACRGVDDWLEVLRTQTPLSPCHTSGTSGSFSFLPWSKSEWSRFMRQYPTTHFQRFGHPSKPEHPPLNVDAIYPYFRRGGISHIVTNDAIVEVICGSEERFHPAYPGAVSSDMMLLAARVRAAKAKGELEKLQLPPELLARRDEFVKLQEEMPRHVARFFVEISERFRGKRVFLQAATRMIYEMAKSGLENGVKGLFAPDSIICTGGGGKGIVLPPNWEDVVKEFVGVDYIRTSFGMSEMAGTWPLCSEGRFHACPWVIPYMLDPVDGSPLPRKGTVTGRFAFYDLLPDTRWGGFITGDEVTMDWDTPCKCGRTTCHLDAKIQRFSEKTGEEDKISCAAASEAYDEALEFLNDFHA